jgi:hypothetical protein
MWSNAVGCCEFHFYGFFIMNILVCFLEKVKIDMLYSFYITINVKHFFLFFLFFLFFFTEHAVSLWNFCGPVTEILVPTLTFVHDGRGPSTNVHPYLRDARSSSFTASKHNLVYFTGDLASFWTTSVIASVRCYAPAVTHHGIMPRYPTIGLFS